MTRGSRPYARVASLPPPQPPPLQYLIRSFHTMKKRMSKSFCVAASVSTSFEAFAAVDDLVRFKEERQIDPRLRSGHHLTSKVHC